MLQNKSDGFLTRIVKWCKDETIFFRKTQDGQYLFYPWGYPGESVFITQEQKHKILLFVYGYGLFMFLWGALSILFVEKKVITRDLGVYLHFILLIAFPTMYVFFMKIITKGKNFLVLPKDDRSIKWGFLWMFSIVFWQIVELYFYANKVPGAFLILCILGFIFTAYVFVKIMQTRGYYFTG